MTYQEDEPMSQGRTALVVDDDEGLAQIVALILRIEGFEVRIADNGAHGFAAYFRNPTDWVITDIQMPELGGLEMMQCIRAINPSVKTVYMSGEVEKYQALLDREAARFAVRVLPKPFTRSNLVEKIVCDDSGRRSALASRGAAPASKEISDSVQPTESEQNQREVERLRRENQRLREERVER
jgi:CheY-like chemotaxis protein